MKLDASVKIHNKFDVEVKDVRTGEVKWRVEAYNIVLDSTWTRLTSLSNIFTNIYFGSGTGMLDKSRTSLFSQLGSKAAVDVTIIKSIPISSAKRKITLLPEEFVGATITEVGIGSSILHTHALLKDSEGNPISITKSATDVVTIYATLYSTFKTQNQRIQFAELPDRNFLVELLANNKPTTMSDTRYFTVGANYHPPIENGFYAYTSTLGSTSLSLSGAIKDYANKKLIIPTTRIPTDKGNGSIKEIGFSNLFRSILPIPGIFEGQSYNDIAIGTGDGVTKEFVLTPRYVRHDSIDVKIDEATTAAYSKVPINRGSNFTGTFQDCNLGAVKNIAFSADGMTMAVAHNNNDGIDTFEMVGGYWKVRPRPTQKPAGATQVCWLTSDGKTLCVGHSNSPFTVIYDWDGSQWVARTNTPIISTYSYLSPDGKALAFKSPTNGFYTYDLVDGKWVEREVLASLKSGNISLSSNFRTMAVASSSAPYVTTYDCVGNTWMERPAIPSPPTSAANYCSLSSDGNVLALTITNAPYLLTYSWNGSNWILRPAPNNPLLTKADHCYLSADGSMLVVYQDSTDMIVIYDWDGAIWKHRTNITITSILPRTMNMSLNGDILAAGGISSPFLNIRDISKKQTKIVFDTPPPLGSTITADYIVDGIHKTEDYIIDLGIAIQFGEE